MQNKFDEYDLFECFSNQDRNKFPPQIDEISLNAILHSEIDLSGKFWFVRKLLIEKQKNVLVKEIAEVVFPIWEPKHSECSIHYRTLRIARLYLDEEINLEQLMGKKKICIYYETHARKIWAGGIAISIIYFLIYFGIFHPFDIDPFIKTHVISINPIPIRWIAEAFLGIGLMILACGLGLICFYFLFVVFRFVSKVVNTIVDNHNNKINNLAKYYSPRLLMTLKYFCEKIERSDSFLEKNKTHLFGKQ
jgi:hypothetical protein